jgi:hypothetical protein
LKFKAYCSANQSFADAIREYAFGDDDGEHDDGYSGGSSSGGGGGGCGGGGGWAGGGGGGGSGGDGNDTVVWIHDYHLLLLPRMLREGQNVPPSTKIGFFLHAPFPSSEIYRILPYREEILVRRQTPCFLLVLLSLSLYLCVSSPPLMISRPLTSNLLHSLSYFQRTTTLIEPIILNQPTN